MCFQCNLHEDACLPPQLTKRRWRRSQFCHSSAPVCTQSSKKTSWVTLKVRGCQTDDFYFYSLYRTCWNKTSHGDFLSVPDMDIKPINKRASGQAFEVILKPSSPVSDVSHCITNPPKRDLSLEDIQKKLEAAEDRRRVSLLLITFIYPSCHGSHQLEPQNHFWREA